MASPPPYGARRVAVLGCLGLAVVLVVLAGIGLTRWSAGRSPLPRAPGQERCVATANGQSSVLSLEQAHYASIIVGVSVRRGLAPRAASIALTTAFQESGIRNLDYGDRDSVGLFQQRPSQGWGSRKQLMDPYYATEKFFAALVRVKGWRTGDITAIAQQVQRSGFPEAYRDHEADARVLASTLTGSSPGGFSCLVTDLSVADPTGLAASLRDTFGTVKPKTTAKQVTLRASNARLAWAYAHYAVANAGRFGVTSVRIGARQWSHDVFTLPEWQQGDDLGSRQVQVTLG